MYRFIVNPNSRSGKSGELWEKLKDRLDREQVPYTAYLTEYAGHARRLAETLSARREPDTLVVLGGRRHAQRGDQRPFCLRTPHPGLHPFRFRERFFPRDGDSPPSRKGTGADPGFLPRPVCGLRNPVLPDVGTASAQKISCEQRSRV